MPIWDDGSSRSRSRGNRHSQRKRSSSRQCSPPPRDRKRSSSRRCSPPPRDRGYSPPQRKDPPRRRSVPRSRRRSSSRRRSPPPRRADHSEERSSSRERSPIRARSVSRGRASSPRPMGGAKAAVPAPVDGEPTEFGKARVLKNPSTGRNETWKAEVDLETGEANHVGRRRIMSIRGPSRTTIERAEEDARKLEAAVPQGPRAVRMVGNQLQKTKIGTT
mmetsp:Transcript_76910/g.148579  ORF Transcript_76910/g.148579 Transcript_76910/m.148579 type:complete len:219 (-) Transcript_76910:200-856(-)